MARSPRGSNSAAVMVGRRDGRISISHGLSSLCCFLNHRNAYFAAKYNFLSHRIIFRLPYIVFKMFDFISAALFLLHLSVGALADAPHRFNAETCCQAASSANVFINAPTRTVCGQTYSQTSPPADPLMITYRFCSEMCPGFGLSSGLNASQWADGFVQFILPSVIFSMIVPRQQKIEVSRLFDYFLKPTGSHRSLTHVTQLMLSILGSFIFVMPFVILDTLSWLAMIFMGAGHMLFAGLHEALIDHKVVSVLINRGQGDRSLTQEETTELLLAVVCGNLLLDVGDPQRKIRSALSTSNDPFRAGEEVKTRLLDMMSAQSSFGSTVGAPVIFYLGAFVYTILNLLNTPSSDDAAISIALGVNWMIIVHVAIVSGCLLASNNPSTSSAIVGLAPEDIGLGPHRAATIDSAVLRKDPTKSRLGRFQIWCGFVREDQKTRHIPLFHLAFSTRFQPVWLWRRGHNKMEWIKRTEAWKNHGWFRERVRLRAWNWFLLFAGTLILIVLPPVAGGVVAYETPPIGWACRSLTLISYGGLQVLLTMLSLVQAATEDSAFWKDWPRLGSFIVRLGWSATSMALAGSLFTSIGGTMMQIMGVYRNCLCYVTTQYWLNPNEGPGINIASDTQEQRDSSQNWITMGTTATAFMAIVCYMGYRYQLELRHHFVAVVEALNNKYVPSINSATAASANGVANATESRAKVISISDIENMVRMEANVAPTYSNIAASSVIVEVAAPGFISRQGSNDAANRTSQGTVASRAQEDRYAEEVELEPLIYHNRD